MVVGNASHLCETDELSREEGAPFQPPNPETTKSNRHKLTKQGGLEQGQTLDALAQIMDGIHLLF